jgi:hypothetical protein
VAVAVAVEEGVGAEVDCRMLRQDELSARRLFAHASLIHVS